MKADDLIMIPEAPATSPGVKAHAKPPAPARKDRRATRYRVRTGKHISWSGSMTFLAEGSVVDASGYGGAAGISRLLDQGVVLDPIDEEA